MVAGRSALPKLLELFFELGDLRQIGLIDLVQLLFAPVGDFLESLRILLVQLLKSLVPSGGRPVEEQRSGGVEPAPGAVGPGRPDAAI